MRELRALKAEQQSEATLRTAQGAAVALTLLLLGVTAAYAWRKWRHARAMQTLVLVDDLTGISNRRSILGSAEAVFADAARQDTPLALLMVDVDHFKAVNDSHGHDVGDEVLRAIAGCIQRDLRQHDRLGRLGGEEFLVVLPGTPAEHAVAVAERIRAAVAEAPLGTSAGELHCTVSIGVAHRTAGDANAGQVLARADDALYRAKSGGRDRVVAESPV
jgi:diguanylate cyclase (GGDEF)-like protein